MNRTPRAIDIQPPATPQGVAPDDVTRIYGLLKRGLGHELVNDDNVKALIELARVDGHALIETELREWRNPCTPAPDPDGQA
ncbi:MAG TPA: hypothetical protein PKA20_29300 [Burkholderiaceae bacterium]|nr:hypothetical protein [Burkholderiaceae bacterium]